MALDPVVVRAGEITILEKAIAELDRLVEQTEAELEGYETKRERLTIIKETLLDAQPAPPP